MNFLAALMVQSGKLRGWRLPVNDRDHLCRVLPGLVSQPWKAKRIHRIWDGGSSQISGETQEFLRIDQPVVRVLLTPAHASWLNQAEL